MKIGSQKKEGGRKAPRLLWRVFGRKVPATPYADSKRKGGELLGVRLESRLATIAIDEMGLNRRSSVRCFAAMDCLTAGVASQPP